MIEASCSAAAIDVLYRINSCVRDECSSLRSITMPENVAIGGDEVFDPAQLRELYDVRYRTATAKPMFFTQPPAAAASRSARRWPFVSNGDASNA